MKRCDSKGMFVALRRRCAVQPPADADLCIGAEGCVPSTFKAANGAEQAHHTLLEEVLAVPSRQKQRTGTGAQPCGHSAGPRLPPRQRFPPRPEGIFPRPSWTGNPGFLNLYFCSYTS